MDPESVNKIAEVLEIGRSLENVANSITPIYELPKRIHDELTEAITKNVEKFHNIFSKLYDREMAKVNDLKTDIKEFLLNPSSIRADNIINRHANLKKLMEEMKHEKLFDICLNQDFLCILPKSDAIAQHLEEDPPQVFPARNKIPSKVFWNDDDDDEVFKTAPIKARPSTINRCHNSPPSPNAENYKIKKRFVFNQLNITAKVLNFVSFEEFYVRNLSLEAEDGAFLESMQKFYQTCSLEVLERPRRGFIAAFKHQRMWHRVRITEVSRNKLYKLFLLDAGRYEEAEPGELIKLRSMFRKHHQISIKCCMSDIKPLEKNNLKFPEKAINEFRILVEDPTYSFQIVFTKNMMENSDEAAPCIVQICGSTDHKVINYNSVLVKNGHAESTGNTSDGPTAFVDPIFKNKQEADRLKLEEAEKIKKENEKHEREMRKPTTRVPVNISKWLGPHEILISVKCRAYEMNRLEEELNNNSNLHDSPSNKNWSENELCLAYIFHSNSMKGKWFRGSITKIIDETMLQVYLIDIGKDIQISKTNIAEIPVEVAAIAPEIIKIHLAKIFPPGNQQSWPQFSLDRFNQIMSSYEFFAISVIDVADERESFPVILYGIAHNQYHNISMYLCDQGLADTSFKLVGEEKFQFEERLVKPWNLKFYDESDVDASAPEIINEILEAYEDETQVYEKDKTITLECGEIINFKPKIIKSWIQSELPRTNQHLYGIVTHVDKDGIIYFQTTGEGLLIQEMTAEITQLYRDTQLISNSDSANRIFQPGDCIISRFTDNNYYRAIIIRKSYTHSRQFRIQYVDFGTLKNISVNDIFSLVVAENVPIQTHRFVLSNIMPKNSNSWTDEELDFFHSGLVDNLCNITVTDVCPSDENIMGAKIEVVQIGKEIKDIGYAAIERGFAKCSSTWPTELKKVDAPENSTLDFIDQMALKLQMEEERKAKLVKKDAMTEVVMAEMKLYIATKLGNEQQVTPRIVNAGRRLKSLNNRNSFKTGFIKSLEDRVHAAKKNLIRKIHTFDLQVIDCERFECYLGELVDATKLCYFVEPQIPEIVEKYEEMEARLRDAEYDSLEHFNNIQKSVGKICLARSLYGKLSRGEVVKLNETSAEIFLVDEGKTVTFPIDALRKIDMRSSKCPRKIIKAKLNLEYKNLFVDVSESLKEKYAGQKLTAIIKNYEDDKEDDIPVIDLLDSDDNLIYQHFIDMELLQQITP